MLAAAAQPLPLLRSFHVKALKAAVAKEPLAGQRKGRWPWLLT